MTATPALLAAAAGVGFGHAVLPDHWVPLAVVGRTQRYPLSKVARLSGLAGVAHVLVSIVLGAAIIAVGLQFRSTVEHAQNVVVGSEMTIPWLFWPLSVIELKRVVDPSSPVVYARAYLRTHEPFTLASISLTRSIK